MADACFYTGFVFERDVSAPLTIEGKTVPIESVHPTNRRDALSIG
jgi:hypothetical protein